MCASFTMNICYFQVFLGKRPDFRFAYIEILSTYTFISPI